MHEKLQEVEADYVMRMVQLDNRLADLVRERDTILVGIFFVSGVFTVRKENFEIFRKFFSQSLHQRTDNDLNTLRKVLSQKEQESRQQQSRLESRIQELEEVQKSFRGKKINYF